MEFKAIEDKQNALQEKGHEMARGANVFAFLSMTLLAVSLFLGFVQRPWSVFTGVLSVIVLAIAVVYFFLLGKVKWEQGKLSNIPVVRVNFMCGVIAVVREAHFQRAIAHAIPRTNTFIPEYYLLFSDRREIEGKKPTGTTADFKKIKENCVIRWDPSLFVPFVSDGLLDMKHQHERVRVIQSHNANRFMFGK